MFRILTLRYLTQNKHKFLSNRSGIVKNPDLSYRKFSCLCNIGSSHAALVKGFNSNFNGQDFISRVHSTTPSAEILQSINKKKKKKSRKKFTELLQVTESSTKQTKTSVQKLKAQKLADFIDNSPSYVNTNEASSSLEYNKYCLQQLLEHEDVSNKLFEETPIIFVGKNMNETKLTTEALTEIMESIHTLKDIQVSREAALHDPKYLEELEATHEDVEHHEVELEEHLVEEHVDSSLKTKKSNKISRYKSKYHKTPELELLAKQKSFAVSLNAYLSVCISSGMVNRGFATVLNYRYRYKKHNVATKLLDIEIYNILLHGYAEKGNMNKIKEIFNILKEDKINLNTQTFAAIFECLGRLQMNPEVLKLIHQYHLEAINRGITLNDIIDTSRFVSDQREVVLSVIKTIEPNFEAIYTPPILTYSNHLLNNLNEHVIPSDQALKEEENVVGSEIMNSKKGFTAEDLKEMGQEQLQHELKGYVIVKSIENHPEPNETVFHYRKKLTELKESWTKQICFAFNRDVGTLRARSESKGNRSINLFPYLKALPVEQFAAILLNEVRMIAEGSETYSPTVGQLYKELGKKVQIRYHMDQKRVNGVLDKTCEIYGMYCDVLSKSNSSDNPRQSWQRLVHLNKHEGPSMDIHEKTWPMAATVGIGKFLYNILMRDLKVDVNVVRLKSKSQNMLPAFYTLFRNQGRLVKEEIKPHPVLARLYRGSQQQTLTFDVNLVPMVCPPQPWSTSVNGGYLIAKSELIRLPHQAHQQWERIYEAPSSHLYPSLDSLNQLASIPWKVNTDILDVILEVFNNGGSSYMDVPQPPTALPPIPDFTPNENESLSKQDKFKHFRKKLSHRRKQAEMYSLWCDALYRLSLANHFRDKTFWLPHNMDFRGRVYPVPPHLNHLGSDLARCLLIFNQPKPLGRDGFNWIKLHCINLTGTMKRDSVADRLRFAEKVMDDILDSADNPLTGRTWWAKSDEPWQTLSVCMEIAKIHRCPDPEKYLCCLPIHQDGSCNGLQHYAALGRDTAGAISVNLAPSRVPQDVYSGIAALVEESRQKDAENNVKVAQVLEGFVRRKVIKQTVMTTVYGVTRFGARLQIAKQLKDIDNFPKDYVWPASTYLTIKTFESLREMFTSTKEIQDWFTDCARLISAVCGQNVEWVTPLGLPVVQPYNRYDKRPLHCKMNNLQDHFQMDSYEKPNVMKQKNAFPPNFIHSLDSSHMMLTSLHCERKGLTFVSVHDCFWTHACTVPVMNEICRQQFLALHSQPILENLSEFLVKKYSYNEKSFHNDGTVVDLTKRKLNRVLQQLPEKGDFDLERVLDSVYFFS